MMPFTIIINKVKESIKIVSSELCVFKPAGFVWGGHGKILLLQPDCKQQYYTIAITGERQKMIPVTFSRQSGKIELQTLPQGTILYFRKFPLGRIKAQ